MERDLTSTRVKEGLAAAAKRGRKGGRPSKQNEKRDALKAMKQAMTDAEVNSDADAE